MKFGFTSALSSTLLLTTLAVGCETPPPVLTDAARADGGPAADAFTAPDAFMAPDAAVDAFAVDAGPNDAGVSDAGPSDAGPSDAGPRVCMAPVTDFPAATDYTCTMVRAALASMPNEYPVVVAGTSGAIARTAAFEQMRTNGLFDVTRDPDAATFTTARMLFDGGGSGLASRFTRRFDPHYTTPVVADSAVRICQTETVWRANSEFCVGPATLAPIALQAFAQGITGDAAEPTRNYAARIEAMNIWFSHVSVYKETQTCAMTFAGADGGRGDCDSAWAYYGGDADRTSAIGYGADVLRLEPATYQRTFDGMLAVRCWREMDTSDVTMQNPYTPMLSEAAIFARAHAQIDAGLDRSVVVVVMDRLRAFEATSGLEQGAHLAFLRALLAPIAARTLTDGAGVMTTYPARVSLMDRMIRARSAADADFIRDEIQRAPAEIDGLEIARRLDARVSCP